MGFKPLGAYTFLEREPLDKGYSKKVFFRTEHVFADLPSATLWKTNTWFGCLAIRNATSGLSASLKI